MQIQDALAQFLVQLEADGRSPHTIAQARRHVELLARFVGNRDVATIEHTDVARFLTSAMACRTPDGRAKKPGSANALRSSVRCFCAYLHAAGLTQTNAARLVRRAICGAPTPKALSDGDRAKLLAALDQAKTKAELRDRAMFRTMLGCGLRLGSAIGLEVGDVDLDAGELQLRRMKGGQQATVFMPREVVDLLRTYLGDRKTGPVFPAANGGPIGAREAHRRLQLWGERARVAGVHPHRLRHSFGTRVYEQTRDLLVTARALTHRSVGSTAVYAQVSDKAVRSAVGA